MRDYNDQHRIEMYEDVSAIQADIKDLHDLFRIDLKNVRKKENSRAITEIGLLLIISIFVNVCMFALLFFIVLKG